MLINMTQEAPQIYVPNHYYDAIDNDTDPDGINSIEMFFGSFEGDNGLSGYIENEPFLDTMNDTYADKSDKEKMEVVDEGEDGEYYLNYSLLANQSLLKYVQEKTNLYFPDVFFVKEDCTNSSSIYINEGDDLMIAKKYIIDLERGLLSEDVDDPYDMLKFFVVYMKSLYETTFSEIDDDE